jgi:O-antigen ligase
LGIVIYFSAILVRIFACYFGDNCAAANNIDVMSIPILTPIVGVYFLLWFKSRWFIYFTIFCLFSFLLVYFGDSRTEVLMFLIMMLVNLIYKKREFLKYSILLLFSPIFVVLFFSYVLNSGDAIYQGDVIKFLYDVSTNRFEIWERAFDFPPENVFLGSGINNTMEFLPENNHGSALHNAYLEIWYETGFLGLLSWLLLVAYLAKDYKRMYCALDSEVRDIYGLFFSGFIALIVAGMFDKGYMSNYFQYYIYYFSAILFVLGRQKSLSE